MQGFICKNSRDSRGLISISGNIRVTLGNRQGSNNKYFCMVEGFIPKKEEGKGFLGKGLKRGGRVLKRKSNKGRG